jgi:uncharacterized protein (TIGR03382 family)
VGIAGGGAGLAAMGLAGTLLIVRRRRTDVSVASS